MSNASQEQIDKWRAMPGRSLCTVVREKFPNQFNGNLQIITKDEMIDLLNGDVSTSALATRLKMRATRRRNGKALGHKPKMKLGSRKLSRFQETTIARMTRKAASPIPPAPSRDVSLADKLAIATALAGLPALMAANDRQLRDGVEAFISVSG